MIKRNTFLLLCMLVLFSFMLVACTTPNEKPAQITQELQLANGTMLQLDARQVIKSINGVDQQMYAYNGQMPGPRLRVKQGSIVFVNFTNNLNEPTTVHWHGLRHDFKDDGVPGISQEPVQPQESFIYTLYFPDEGIFWYHPHVREDRQQDLGLYGNIIVEPISPIKDQIDREIFLFLDDILIENGKNVAYGKESANFVLMGRFGNVMLVNGETNYTTEVQQGETVRFYMTNAGNARPFNFSIANTKLKLIGSDFGTYERETFVDSIIIGPAERYTFDVIFTEPGNYTLRNINLWQQYVIGHINVQPNQNAIILQSLQNNSEASEDIDFYRAYLDKPVDKEVILGIEVHGEAEEMHSLTNIEWEDTMLDDNRITTPKDITWFIEDNETKLRNMNLTYQFKTGDIKKMRFINDNTTSKHPMQHLIHLHGQRFLIVEENGVKSDNLVWKDTFLVPSGFTTDILLDASNPGKWMFHCHIAEHLEAGMMSSFVVSDEDHQYLDNLTMMS